MRTNSFSLISTFYNKPPSLDESAGEGATRTVIVVKWWIILGFAAFGPCLSFHARIDLVLQSTSPAFAIKGISDYINMGTLTGNMPRLPEHCGHKLPTSCRLTATPLCCACQDKRPHSSRYSMYVDGVGLVMRGTRWQRYCYFCREFWSNRVLATEPPMEASETRIPEIPDQTPFLEAWFNFHRGYRTESGEDGQQRRIELALEKPWRDVDPGTLPVLNEAERRMALRSLRAAQITTNEHTSLDETLDSLLEQAEDGEEPADERDESDEQVRAAVERAQELQRAADARQIDEAQAMLEDADRTFTQAVLRKQRAVCELEAAETELRSARSQRRSALRDLQVTRNAIALPEQREAAQNRSAQRLARVFGTRDDIERQGSEYVSPLTNLFTRAYERFRIAEEVRAGERASSNNTERHREFLANLAERQYPALFNAIQNQVNTEAEDETEIRTLDDEEDDRPPPKSDEELSVRLVCKVCLQQTADTAVLPCGHLVMCSFCADIVVPARPNDHTAPATRSSCPMCRKNISRRVRIFTS